MLELKNITKIYNEHKIVLNEVSLDFNSFGLHIITGDSGSGKTTLLNIISTLEYATYGKIILNNIDLSSLNKNELEETRIKNISYVFQEFNLIEDMTVKENLEIVLSTNLDSSDKMIRQALIKVGLAKYLNTEVKKLSGGERQRVAIARSLISNTNIILADEPTANLDDDTGRAIMSLLKEISKEHLIILVTHNINYANTYADRIIRIEKGVIKEDRVINYLNESIKPNQDIITNRNDKKVIKNFFITNLRNSFTKTLLSISLFVIFILLNLISSTLLTVNPENGYMKYIDSLKYEFLDLCYRDTDNLMFYKYNTLSEKFQDLSCQYIDIDNLYYDNQIFGNTLIVISTDYSLVNVDTDNIVITDYLAYNIIDYSITDVYKQKEDLIGMQLMYNDYPLVISSVLETNYLDINENQLNSYYTSGFINQQTLNNIYNLEDLELIANYYLEGRQIDRRYDTLITEDSNLSSNQVIISNDLSRDLLNSRELNIILENKTRNKLDLNCEIFNINEDDNITNTIYVSSEYYKMIKGFSYNGGIIIQKSSINSSLVLDLQSNGLYINTEYKDNYINMSFIKNITLIIFIVINICSFIILIQIYHSFLFQRIQSRKKDYIILKSIGNSLTINKIVTYEISFSLIISLIIALIFYLLFTNILSDILMSAFKLSPSFSILLPILYVCIISVIIFVIIRYSFILKINKTRELDIIN